MGVQVGSFGPYIWIGGDHVPSSRFTIAAAYVREPIGHAREDTGSVYPAKVHLLRVIRSLAATANEFLGGSTPMPKV